MFSGIVETTAQVLDYRPRNEVFELTLARPESFDDIKSGDSIAVNGVCLTVESFDSRTLKFALATETLNITGWNRQNFAPTVNLERSLRFGDRVHGHLVQGHVDAMGKVVAFDRGSESAILKTELPTLLRPLVWKKGSLAINGVSLTVNDIISDATGSTVEFCLIPETLQRTNLSNLKVGDSVTLEADSFARYLHHMKELS